MMVFFSKAQSHTFERSPQTALSMNTEKRRIMSPTPATVIQLDEQAHIYKDKALEGLALSFELPGHQHMRNLLNHKESSKTDKILTHQQLLPRTVLRVGRKIAGAYESCRKQQQYPVLLPVQGNSVLPPAKIDRDWSIDIVS